MRTSARRLNPSLKNQIVKTFAQTIVDFKDMEEALTFLKDFFTESELEVYVKRLAVGYWLAKKRSYTNIRENLKVSTATIAEVAGMAKTHGFKLGVKKIEAEEWANKWAEKIRGIGNRIVD